MSEEEAQERERVRRWVETWRRVGPELEEIRRRELQELDSSGKAQAAIRQVLGSAELLRRLPVRTTSGLVEQQALFRKLRG